MILASAEPRKRMTLEQAADYLGKHPHTLERWARGGKVRACKVGREWRFTLDDLENFIESGANVCQSSKEKAPVTGNVNGALAAKQLKNLLEQPTGKRRRNSTTAEVLNFGDYKNSVNTQRHLKQPRSPGGPNTPALSAAQRQTESVSVE